MNVSFLYTLYGQFGNEEQASLRRIYLLHLLIYSLVFTVVLRNNNLFRCLGNTFFSRHLHPDMIVSHPHAITRGNILTFT